MTNKEFFINSWQHESKVTSKAFRSLPNDENKINKSHHPNFRSPWEIVNHIGPHGKELIQAVSEGKLDLVNEGKFPLTGPKIYKGLEAAAQDVEASATTLIDLVKKCDDTIWATKIIPVYWGQNKIFEMPLGQLCWVMHNDIIHHRGQLSSYYRSLGVTQPNLYGPTLEEEIAMMANVN